MGIVKSSVQFVPDLFTRQDKNMSSTTAVLEMKKEDMGEDMEIILVSDNDDSETPQKRSVSEEDSDTMRVNGKKRKEDVEEKYNPATSPISPVKVVQRMKEEKKKTDPWKGLIPPTPAAPGPKDPRRKIKFSSIKDTTPSPPPPAPPGSNGTPPAPGTVGSTPPPRNEGPLYSQEMFTPTSPLMVEFQSPNPEVARRMEKDKLQVFISDDTKLHLDPE